MVPFPGTEVLVMAKQGIGGLRLLSTDWKDYAKQSGNALSSITLSNRQLKKFQAKAYLRFYLRPSRIKNLLELTNLKGILKMGISLINKKL